MPSLRARTLGSIAVTILVGSAGMVLGYGRRTPLPREPEGHGIEPEAPAPAAMLRGTGPSQVRRGGIYAVLAVILLAAGGIYGGYELKFSGEARARAIALTAGDPDIGLRLTRHYGCAGCHVIPGVPGGNGKVGPSLAGIAARLYIGGVVTNDPENLVRWIENPRAIDPKTAMPATGISREEARHVAAYLYTLR